MLNWIKFAPGALGLLFYIFISSLRFLEETQKHFKVEDVCCAVTCSALQTSFVFPTHFGTLDWKQWPRITASSRKKKEKSICNFSLSSTNKSRENGRQMRRYCTTGNKRHSGTKPGRARCRSKNCRQAPELVQSRRFFLPFLFFSFSHLSVMTCVCELVSCCAGRGAGLASD